MRQRTSEPSLSDSIDEFFEPALGDASEDDMDEDTPLATGKNRIAELRLRGYEPQAARLESWEPATLLMRSTP